MAPSRKKKTIAAAAFVAFGVILFVTAGSVLGVVVGGLGIAVFGWAMTRPSATALVGMKCAHCGDGIYIEGHADRCVECAAPLHARCIDAHTTAKHRSAYR